jgi:hypothetical protein
MFRLMAVFGMYSRFKKKDAKQSAIHRSAIVMASETGGLRLTTHVQAGIPAHNDETGDWIDD